MAVSSVMFVKKILTRPKIILVNLDFFFCLTAIKPKLRILKMYIFCRNSLQGNMEHEIITVTSTLNVVFHKEGSNIYLNKILFLQEDFIMSQESGM